MKAVILAGGMGTRISEESHLRPKPMIEVGGKPILWHIMKIYSHYGFHEFIICCGYRGYMIKEYFADYYLHCSDVTFDFTDGGAVTVHSNVSEPWKVTVVDTGLKAQTGARIKRIQPYVQDEAFMLTYGDGVSDVDLGALLTFHRQNGRTATITAIQPGGRFGMLEFGDRLGKPGGSSGEGRSVMDFIEKGPDEGGWINGGFMVLEPGVFRYLSDEEQCVFETGPMKRLAADGELDAYCHHGFWQCMDTQRDRGLLERLWEAGNAPWKVWG